MDDKTTEEVDLAEALQMQILINQALIDILIEKGVITQEKLLTRIEELRAKLPKVTIQ